MVAFCDCFHRGQRGDSIREESSSRFLIQRWIGTFTASSHTLIRSSFRRKPSQNQKSIWPFSNTSVTPRYRTGRTKSGLTVQKPRISPGVHALLLVWTMSGLLGCGHYPGTRIIGLLDWSCIFRFSSRTVSCRFCAAWDDHTNNVVVCMPGGAFVQDLSWCVCSPVAAAAYVVGRWSCSGWFFWTRLDAVKNVRVS